jgi:putative transposase
MPNHIHLLIETAEPNLGEGMQRLQSLYAQVFNATYGRSGHLFQGRFGAVRIRTQPQLDVVLDYIARNPVEAGLCRTSDDWPWSRRDAPELVSRGLRGLA